MTLDEFNSKYKFVNALAENALNFIFDKQQRNVTFEFIEIWLDYINNKNFAKGKQSPDFVNLVDAQVKKTCIKMITDKVSEKEDPFEDYSSERLKQYRDNLSEIVNRDSLPWIFDYIIEIVDLQCSEFSFIIFYNRRLIEKFDSVQQRQSVALSKIQDISAKAEKQLQEINKTSLETQKRLEEAKDVSSNATKAIQDAEGAIGKAKNAYEIADEASKKITDTTVTVLGMFTGIVITIVAGILFASSVLGNVAESNFFRLICAASLVGLICFHLIALMFRFIDKFRDRKSTSIRLSPTSILVSSFLLIVFVATFIMQIIFPVKCDNHSSSDWIIEQKATCTESGVRYKKCIICDKILEKENIIRLGHNYQIITDKNPTCSEEGMFHKKCIICGETTISEIMAAVGHNYENVIIKQATESEDGLLQKKCTVCGNVLATEIIPA